MNRLLRRIALSALLVTAATTQGAIDRHALVSRHAITWNEAAGQIPLGNGEFCFNADGTGLQTFGGNTMSHWGWHSFPPPTNWPAERIPPTGTFQQGRNTGPDVFPPDQAELRKWLFDNPHILNLGRLRLCRADGTEIAPGDITGLTRTLDLWSGQHVASYQIAGESVRVETCVHPTLDAVAVRIVSPLIERGALQVALDFPYPTLKKEAWVGDFARVDGHTTTVQRTDGQRADFERRVDGTSYRVSLAWSVGGQLNDANSTEQKSLEIRKAEYGGRDRWIDVADKIRACVTNHGLSITPGYQWLGDPLPGQAKRLRLVYVRGGEEKTVEIHDNATFAIRGAGSPHRFLLSGPGTNQLEFLCAYASEQRPGELPTIGTSFVAVSNHWNSFWTTGGAIDLSGSKDPRWRELERRIVLSQYLMAAQSAGSYPSAETGLMGLDPWRSQFHMEMVWWHVAHYALWDRWNLAERQLTCYQRFTPAARALAEQLGYKGLKWPKSVGPEGRSAPWVGNQVLLWKQPHPIFFAELEYRARPTRATLEKWADVVQGTAEHMADYPTRNETNGVYSLAPAMPPSEQGITRDPVFDLAYWRWGLDQAQAWRERMGLAREPRWDEVRKQLAPLPTLDGVFVHSAEWSDTYTKRAWEHPDPVGVFGMLPPIEGVDEATALRTMRKVWTTWNWDKCWGWDFPWMAMAAARNGEPQIAVDALLKESARNHYDTRGVNTGGPCPYLPGNGGLLYAVALMAAGWDGAPDQHAPGFPSDGSWVVHWEGLKKAP